MNKVSNFKEVQTTLEDLVVKSRNKSYSLDALRACMQYLGNPQDKIRVIHIAGTSGKSSTAYYIDALLLQSGYNTGLTVSPHVDSISERVRVNGNNLSEAEFCNDFTIFFNQVSRSGIQLSYLEVLIAFAYWKFAQANVDFAVIETGLGGLLDCTNIVTRADKISVITDIGLDHTEILGSTLSEITAQKAGIILPKSLVFMHKQSDKILSIIKSSTQAKKATLYACNPGAYKNPYVRSLPLFQQRNFSLACAVVDHILQHERNSRLTSDIMMLASSVYVPARMEIAIYNNKEIILDGSHNPQKIKALTSSIIDQYGAEKIPILVSFGENKKQGIAQSLMELRKISKNITITTFTLEGETLRSPLSTQVLKNMCLAMGFNRVTVIEDPRKAFEFLMKHTDKRLLVTGSYFLLSHIRPLVLQNL